MFAFTDLRDLLAVYLTDEEVEKITKAYITADKAHEGQKRYTGEPYITHPIEVARILGQLKMDAECICAAILHDVIEDTRLDKKTIAANFGEKVAELVDGVSKLTQISCETRELQQAENFRKMMMAMAQDIRVIIIKLADRLHNMRTLGALPYPKKRRIAQETLEIYAPIAHRLGMNNMRIEFEDLGFAALYPIRYRVLKESVRKARGNRHALIHKIEQKLVKQLEDLGMTDCKVWGREKHLYSLYQKMQAKRLSFTEVMDVYAFRIIVKRKEDCYTALGCVHSLYRPITKRFKDYIAVPKPNGYQSLHTSLIGPHGVPIEAQIRTFEMEQVAEHGIASHWLYKSGEQNDAISKHFNTNQWLKGLIDIQKHTGNPLEFIENVKIDLYPNEVYVFTPKGSIFSLPQGATSVDFAYLIHTDIGNTCVACKINRRLAPLSTRLKNGQMVEIINAEGAYPNPAWLSFVVTGKAKSNIRHWLKNQQRTESVQLGRRLINGILAETGLNISAFEQEELDAILQKLSATSLDNVLEEVGLGKRMAALVAQVFLDEQHDSTPIHDKAKECLVIQGTEGLVVTYASCCYPIPGDLIMGYLKPGQGIVIHTENCSKIKKYKSKPNHCINVKWEREIKGEFQVPIIVDVINDRGVLAQLANAISETNANILNVNVDQRDTRVNTVRFVVSVRDRPHLARIMRRLRAVGEVTRIKRGK